jgi:hypothetical protein
MADQESREVKESRSRRVEQQKARADTKSRSQFGKRPLASQLLNFSTSELQYRRNKARMLMKTKDEARKVEKLRSRGVEGLKS